MANVFQQNVSSTPKNTFLTGNVSPGIAQVNPANPALSNNQNKLGGFGQTNKFLSGNQIAQNKTGFDPTAMNFGGVQSGTNPKPAANTNLFSNVSLSNNASNTQNSLFQNNSLGIQQK
jgi:hypothetical protein